MALLSNDDLIASAQAVLHRRESGHMTSGQVASTLVTVQGSLYSGVCVDTP
ncbi:hypothetical protein [Nonomuraea montanisoli]|uniref:hypothetical protein n=1 Tax=Nonomuraea montanisoli TaxID=2741721 RepID=UPI001965AE63|nr:hypothetical protein [Nonomuraea montanisoli]